MAWNATLSIDYQSRERRTHIARIHHQGPLTVQKSFYPDDTGIVHNYILHPPGGLVGGDRLDIAIRLDQKARVLLTTPASGKIYRTPNLQSQVHFQISMEQDSQLYWLPQENILFDGAHHEQTTDVNLHETSCFTAWDIACLGRPGAGERFQRGSLFSHLQLSRVGKPLFLERLLLDGGSPMLDKAWGLAGYCSYGTMLLHWPTRKKSELLMGDQSAEGVELGLSQREEWIVARARAHCPLKLREQFLRVLRALSQLHFDTTFALPRIWQY